MRVPECMQCAWPGFIQWTPPPIDENTAPQRPSAARLPAHASPLRMLSLCARWTGTRSISPGRTRPRVSSRSSGHRRTASGRARRGTPRPPAGSVAEAEAASVPVLRLTLGLRLGLLGLGLRLRLRLRLWLGLELISWRRVRTRGMRSSTTALAMQRPRRPSTPANLPKPESLRPPIGRDWHM